MTDEITAATQPEAKSDTILNHGDHWGLPDSVAVVGKIFQYNLTPINEKSTSEYFQMEEDDEKKLPPWLFWNSDSNSLEGVAPLELKGQLFFVQLSVISKPIKSEATSTISKEYLNIKLLEHSSQPDALNSHLEHSQINDQNEIRNIYCDASSPVTTTTVILDVDITTMSSREKVTVLKALATFLGLPSDIVRLQASENLPMLNSAALVAGPGDTINQKYAGVLVQWEVGCGNVFASYMPVLELLEFTASNGSLGKAIGLDIVGWHITNSRTGLEERRLKRRAYLHINPTATPIPSLVYPTAFYSVTTLTVVDTNEGPNTRTILDPSSLWMPPQLEIMVKTRTAGAKPVQPTESPATYPSRVTPEVYQTQGFPDRFKSSVPPGVESASSSSPGDIEPSENSFTKHTMMLPTASLPAWPRYPTEFPDLTRYPERWSKHPDDHKDWTFPPFDVSQSPSTDVIDPNLSTSEFGAGFTGPIIQETGRVTPKHSSPKVEKITRRPPKTPRPITGEAGRINPPELLNALPNIEIEAGRFLWFRIPNDTFFDIEDGSTEHLSLLPLMTDDGHTVQPTSWVKLNKINQVLYGLPLKENLGVHRFVVAAIDSSHQIVKSPIAVTVLKSKIADKLSHEFSITLDLDFKKFIYDLDTQFAVINKIAQAFGDADSRKITITGIFEGSVEIRWTNNTIPLDPCPVKAIMELSKYFIHENGTLNETFVLSMLPYHVISAGGAPRGSCLDEHMPSNTTDVSHKEKSTSPLYPPEPEKRIVPPSNLLLYIVVAIVVFVVLLLILIIICIACYKRQRRRREKEGIENEKLSGLHKGIPIIFADELDDPPTKAGDVEATPASTLRSAKSKRDSDIIETVPPPEYPRSKPGSAYSTLRSDWKEPLLSSEDEENNANDEGKSTIQKKAEKTAEDDKENGTLPMR